MKILCINPPVYTFSYFINANHYPTGLYNVATYYKNQGHSVNILDMNPEINCNDEVVYYRNNFYYHGLRLVNPTGNFLKCGNFDSEKIYKKMYRFGLPLCVIEDELRNNKYDLILVQCTLSYLWKGAHEAIEICKKVAPETPVWLGGIYTSLCPEKANSSLADKVVRGRLWEGSPFITSDTSLFPYRPIRVSTQASYGCRNACRYCAVTRLEGAQRIERPVGDVLSDIKSKIYAGYKNIRFLDSNILSNWENHYKKILEGIIDLNADLDLIVLGGVEPGMLKEEHVALMKKAGFSKIGIPLETSDTEQLKKWNRPSTLDEYKKAIEIALKHFDNKVVTSYIMLGYPGHKFETAMESINLCKSLGCVPEILAFTPVPGTSMEDGTRDLENLNPLLWPNAWEGFTVRQFESIFEEYATGKYISEVIKYEGEL